MKQKGKLLYEGGSLFSVAGRIQGKEPKLEVVKQHLHKHLSGMRQVHLTQPQEYGDS